MAFIINNFANGAKPLPVFLLLDVSGSMSGDKINQLNNAVEEMIASFTVVDACSSLYQSTTNRFCFSSVSFL